MSDALNQVKNWFGQYYPGLSGWGFTYNCAASQAALTLVGIDVTKAQGIAGALASLLGAIAVLWGLGLVTYTVSQVGPGGTILAGVVLGSLTVAGLYLWQRGRRKGGR